MAYTTIDKPSDYFETVIYTGNGVDGRAITDLDFQPDWCWFKSRSAAGNWHDLYDSVRGATKRIFSNESDAEQTQSAGLQSFTSNGFTLGTNSDVNQNSVTYASWNWKAETSFTNDASSTGIGTIDSTGSASDTAGFSIVSYTGTGSAGTIKHGLSAVPKMIIIKSRSAVKDWTVYHNSISAENYLELNQTLASTDSSSVFNDTAPTSSVFSVGTNGQTNGSSTTYIAYCFAEKKGFSKFSSYVGNGSSDGSYIHLGFSPSFVMVKKTNGTGNWVMFDNKRNTFNVVNKRLVANLSDDEGTSDRLDFLSNGWKFRSTATNVNGSDSYIYMAFAEAPFVTSGGIPTTAR